MTETENQTQGETSQTSAIEQLRNEMNEQYNALKESFESSLKEKDDELVKLREENKDLHRALTRSAFSDRPEPPKEKTPEEIYQEKVDALSKKTLHYMESM